MKLTKMETEILTRALKNQTAEKREAPHWQPAVKCPVHSTTREIAGGENCFRLIRETVTYEEEL